MRTPSTSPARLPSVRLLTALALLGFLVSLLGFGAALHGFSHSIQPVALLGARGVPRWWAFDLFGFLLPGLLAWAATVRLSIADRARDADGDVDRVVDCVGRGLRAAGGCMAGAGGLALRDRVRRSGCPRLRDVRRR